MSIPKIQVATPLVILHGDEMAQVAFEQILNQFIRNQLDIDLIEIDLGAENRLVSNGRCIREAIDALKEYGVGVKNAGMTLNQDQLDALLEKHPELSGAELDPLAYKSPNGAIRKGIAGNITREDIPFKNLRFKAPEWIGRDITVITMDQGGIVDSHNELSEAAGILKLLFVGSSGEPLELHRRMLELGDPWLLATNDIESVTTWAHEFFKRGLEESRDVYLGLKDTVIPGYDGVMRTAIEQTYDQIYRQKYEQAKLRASLKNARKIAQ